MLGRKNFIPVLLNYCTWRRGPDQFLVPNTQDLDKLQRLLRYVNGTKDIWLTLEPDDQWRLFAHIDAACGVHPDGKGHTGVCMIPGKGAFYVASVKQNLLLKQKLSVYLMDCQR